VKIRNLHFFQISES